MKKTKENYTFEGQKSERNTAPCDGQNKSSLAVDRIDEDRQIINLIPIELCETDKRQNKQAKYIIMSEYTYRALSRVYFER